MFPVKYRNKCLHGANNELWIGSIKTRWETLLFPCLETNSLFKKFAYCLIVISLIGRITRLSMKLRNIYCVSNTSGFTLYNRRKIMMSLSSVNTCPTKLNHPAMISHSKTQLASRYELSVEFAAKHNNDSRT